VNRAEIKLCHAKKRTPNGILKKQVKAVFFYAKVISRPPCRFVRRIPGRLAPA